MRHEPAGAAAYLKALQTTAKAAKFSAPLYWAYRTLGPQLDSPVLSSVWFQAVMNGVVRRGAVVRVLGPEWQDKNAFEVGLELFRRLLAHPEGIEVAELDVEANLDERIGFEDGKVRLIPEAIVAELGRAVSTQPAEDPDYPFVLASGPADPLDRQYHSARSELAQGPRPSLRLEPLSRRCPTSGGDRWRPDSASHSAGAGRTAGGCGQKAAGGTCVDAERFRYDLPD